MKKKTRKGGIPRTRRPETRRTRLLGPAPAPRQQLVVVRSSDEVQGAALPQTLTENPIVQFERFAQVVIPKDERIILATPTDPDKIQVLPSGEAYYPHVEYRRLLNVAFGPGAWALMPTSAPVQKGKTIAQSFTMIVRGSPVAHAYGEANYHENNKRMTYATALESCESIALRRCCKKLGMTLELWDKTWLDEWADEHVIVVDVRNRDGEIDRQCRLKRGRPLPFEVGGAGSARAASRRLDVIDVGGESSSRGQQQHAPARQESRGYDATGDTRPVSVKQLDRLFKFQKHAGVKNATLVAWLKTIPHLSYIFDPRTGQPDSNKIQRQHYDAICNWVEGQR